MEWQPISTAPKDGTEFLAYDVLTKRQDVCMWCDFWNEPKQVQRDGEYGPLSDEFGYDRRAIQWWMPLPQPPQSSDRSNTAGG
jgi:hypothetical protein